MKRREPQRSENDRLRAIVRPRRTRTTRAATILAALLAGTIDAAAWELSGSARLRWSETESDAVLTETSDDVYGLRLSHSFSPFLRVEFGYQGSDFESRVDDGDPRRGPVELDVHRR